MSLLHSLLRTNKELAEVENFSGHASPTSPKTETGSEVIVWSCSYCSQPLTIDDVCPSLDGERMLTIWRCDPCGVAGVTPDAIKEPPVWVKTTQQ